MKEKNMQKVIQNLHNKRENNVKLFQEFCQCLSLVYRNVKEPLHFIWMRGWQWESSFSICTNTQPSHIKSILSPTTRKKLVIKRCSFKYTDMYVVCPFNTIKLLFVQSGWGCRYITLSRYNFEIKYLTFISAKLVWL